MRNGELRLCLSRKGFVVSPNAAFGSGGPCYDSRRGSGHGKKRFTSFSVHLRTKDRRGRSPRPFAPLLHSFIGALRENGVLAEAIHTESAPFRRALRQDGTSFSFVAPFGASQVLGAFKPNRFFFSFFFHFLAAPSGRMRSDQGPHTSSSVVAEGDVHERKLPRL